MDSILPYLEANIDFKGQKLAEFNYQLILTIGCIISIIIGFLKQDLSYTVYTFAASIIISLIVVLPPYKQYRSNPVNFLPKKNTSTTTETTIDIEY
ncbi:hypothetical protein CANARDRAFT_196129 [[Candida] arabinofermentans NRRL YB-2248]|uniref:Signal peptidase complex subunit 1 n=1 Tax=[Candida] arabinofermentans NRRL YB-2248 TaxID=983967 RepID=A0A1E4T4F8_9ASCO|nr:hypothetical protein CANARDRAFT_196129 [[Candida] arabinofermentans NRRL YB-2248]